jgi:hypothetical protein
MRPNTCGRARAMVRWHCVGARLRLMTVRSQRKGVCRVMGCCQLAKGWPAERAQHDCTLRSQAPASGTGGRARAGAHCTDGGAPRAWGAGCPKWKMPLPPSAACGELDTATCIWMSGGSPLPPPSEPRGAAENCGDPTSQFASWKLLLLTHLLQQQHRCAVRWGGCGRQQRFERQPSGVCRQRLLRGMCQKQLVSNQMQ